MLTGNPWLDLVLKGVFWAIAAFVGAYLAHKGHHRAIKEDFKEILNRTQTEAEAKKRGETEAVQKDLQRILDQLRQTTELAKQIEADIAHRAQDRQMRLDLKRDLYMRLLEAIGEKILTLHKLIRLETLLKDSRPDPARIEARLRNHRAACESSDELTRKIQAVAAVACISLPADTVSVLDVLSAQIDGQASRDAGAPPAQQAIAEVSLYKQAFNQFAAFAKRDLGPPATR
jgi:hypothetical protein